MKHFDEQLEHESPLMREAIRLKRCSRLLADWEEFSGEEGGVGRGGKGESIWETEY